MQKIRFGILSTARIATEYVIPAMMQGAHTEIRAIASRDASKAREAADRLGIPVHYGTYEELLLDDTIDAVYNPLPNHLHVPWAIKAVKAGKHVLCEKPVALSAEEAQLLLNTAKKSPGIKVMEAFMYRFQPRWQELKRLIEEGVIGELKAIHSYFSYFNDDKDNVRNKAGMGGGGLMDIGCYSISSARFLFGREPRRASGVVEMEPEFQVDRLASGLLDFGTGTCVFTCTMRSPRYQYIKLFGTEGFIHMDQPFNPPFDEHSSFTIHTGGENSPRETKTVNFEPCNHFTIQGDRFADSILNDTPVPTPLEDAVANMVVLDKLKP